MRITLKQLLGGAIIGAALAIWTLATVVLAQSIGQNDISGSECWNAGQGPGGPSTGFLCVNSVRGSQPIVASTPTGATTIGQGSLVALATGGTLMFGGQPAAAAVTLTAMASPEDGTIFEFCNPTASAFATTNISFVTNTGQSIVPSTVSSTTLAANTCIQMQYARSTTTWYRIR